MKKSSRANYILSASIAFSGILIAGAVFYSTSQRPPSVSLPPPPAGTANLQGAGDGINKKNLEPAVLPAEGVTLPIRWGDLGKLLRESGVIDDEKLEVVYQRRGGLSEENKALLADYAPENLKLTRENAGLLLNLLWAFGLSNKNAILEEGPMQDPRYGGAGNFASTGGWVIAKGSAMDHYSKHSFVELTPEQQKLVERVSKNIYRPCCGNPTYFPDCNHGMAMLGLLELLAAQGASEEEMYKLALQVNSFWFPDTYLTIAQYFDKKGVDWSDVDPQTVLGSAYSSAGGYRQILSEIQPVQRNSGPGCGV